MPPDFTSLSDTDLLREIVRREQQHQFFWAAEKNWSAERDAREANDIALAAAQEEAKRRGLMPAPQAADVA